MQCSMSRELRCDAMRCVPPSIHSFSWGIARNLRSSQVAFERAGVRIPGPPPGQPAPPAQSTAQSTGGGGGDLRGREAASACSWAAGGPASPAGPRPCGSWIVAAGEGPALAEHAERSGAERILQCSGLCGGCGRPVFVEFQELCSDHLTSSQAKTRQCCGRGAPAPGPQPPPASRFTLKPWLAGTRSPDEQVPW